MNSFIKAFLALCVTVIISSPIVGCSRQVQLPSENYITLFDGKKVWLNCKSNDTDSFFEGEAVGLKIDPRSDILTFKDADMGMSMAISNPRCLMMIDGKDELEEKLKQHLEEQGPIDAKGDYTPYD